MSRQNFSKDIEDLNNVIKELALIYINRILYLTTECRVLSSTNGMCMKIGHTANKQISDHWNHKRYVIRPLWN